MKHHNPHASLKTISARTEQILDSLKSKGARLTKARKALVQILEGADSPLSATDIIERLLAVAVDVNKTTAYREIEFFMQEGLVREVDLLDGKKRYELSGGTAHHHHHFVCTKCQNIQCIDLDCNLDRLEESVAERYQVTIERHILEFFGQCERCRECAA